MPSTLHSLAANLPPHDARYPHILREILTSGAVRYGIYADGASNGGVRCGGRCTIIKRTSHSGPSRAESLTAKCADMDPSNTQVRGGEDARIRLELHAEAQNEFLRWSRGAISAYVGIPAGTPGSPADVYFPSVLTKFYEAR